MVRELDVIDVLTLRRIAALGGEVSASALSNDMLCHKKRVQRWLNRLEHLGLVETEGTIYTLSGVGARFVRGDEKEERVRGL